MGSQLTFNPKDFQLNISPPRNGTLVQDNMRCLNMISIQHKSKKPLHTSQKLINTQTSCTSGFHRNKGELIDLFLCFFWFSPSKWDL